MISQQWLQRLWSEESICTSKLLVIIKKKLQQQQQQQKRRKKNLVDNGQKLDVAYTQFEARTLGLTSIDEGGKGGGGVLRTVHGH